MDTQAQKQTIVDKGTPANRGLDGKLSEGACWGRCSMVRR